MKICEVKERIVGFEREGEELIRIYRHLDRQLFNYKPRRGFLMRPWEERGKPKKLSLEELAEAVKSSVALVGEKMDVSSTSAEEVEKEITSLIISLYQNCSRALIDPTIKKKITSEGIKYSLVDNYQGCFISTACVEVAGLPDNCDELQTLRTFRDGFIANLPEGRNLIGDYYRVAPKIVSSIRTRPDSHDIFSRIFKEDVLVAVDKVKKGDSAGALQHYKEMVCRLRRKYN